MDYFYNFAGKIYNVVYNHLQMIFLLQSAAHGNKEAFERLFRDYYPKVMAMLSGMIKDEFIAENIAQDIFMKLWVNRKHLPEIKSMDDYLYICSRNAAICHLKTCRKTITYVDPCICNVGENDTECDVLMDELYAIIRKEIAKMPPQRRRVFEMSRFEELSTKEISRQLGISPRTVERHLAMALSTLRKIDYVFLLVLMNAN